MNTNKTATLLNVTGWCLFLICLFLPVLNDTRNDSGIPGWFAGYFAIQTIFKFGPNIDWMQFSTSGIGNLLSLFIIFSGASDNKKLMKLLSILFLAFSLTSLSYLYTYSHTELHSGYYLWVISLFILSYAHYHAYKHDA